MKTFLISIFVLVFTFTVCGQNSPISTLSNQDIIEMSKAGIPASVIISKINVSETDFDTDIEALKTLTAEKVPETVISAMIEKRVNFDPVKPPDNSAAPPEKKPVVYTDDAPEHGNVSEISEKTKVYVDIDNPRTREYAVKVLAKYPRLTIVDRVDDSEFTLFMSVTKNQTGASVIGSTVTDNHNYYADLYALTRGSIDENGVTHKRIVWSYRKVQSVTGGITFDKNPAAAVVDRFIKDLKKARGEK